MSIQKQIKTGGLILAGAFLFQTALTAGMEHNLANAIEDQNLMGPAIHNHMQADMMHDAIRSAVFRALHGAERGNTAERESAIKEVTEFGDEMRRVVNANRSLPLDADIHAGLVVIAGQLDTYTHSASDLVLATRSDPAAAEAKLADFDKAFRALEESQEAQSQRIEARMAQVTTHGQWLTNASLAVLVVLSLLFGGLLLFAQRALNKRVILPIGTVAAHLKQMIAGDYNVALVPAHGNDEVAAVQEAAIALREAGLARERAEQAQVQVVSALGQGLNSLASGDLTHSINEPFVAEYDSLRDSFNRSTQALSSLFSNVLEAAERVSLGADEIRVASEDLARRNQQQAASVEESAAALAQVTSMVRDTANSTVDVRESAAHAHEEACSGGTVVTQAVSAMADIESSANQISSIVSVIDGIAFQTNLLALNAGVEAARAGESGKGFAVVANEVRALAQRSSDAAQDIKRLITSSAEQVSIGVKLVNETGALLDQILGRVGSVNTGIGEIAASADRQASSLQQVSSTVVSLDRVTQQNAAMVEETTAAARSLAQEAATLGHNVAQFRITRPASGYQRSPASRAA